MLLILLLLAVAAQAHVGYLVAPGKTVSVIRSVVPLTLNVTPLSNLYDILIGFEEDLVSITEELVVARNCTVNPTFIDHWMWQLENVNVTLNSIIHTSLIQDDETTTLPPATPGDKTRNRRKRGLFDFIGVADK